MKMTNFEKYKDEILEIGLGFAVKDEKPVECDECKCTECNFYDDKLNSCGYCNIHRAKWLYEEYQEPSVDWSKVAVDTKILVSNDGEHWRKMHFARYDGEIFTWIEGLTSWSSESDFDISCWKYAKLAEEEDD